MSKIGRKGIPTRDVQVTVREAEVQFKGKHGAGVYTLPSEFSARIDGDMLYIDPVGMTAISDLSKKVKAAWGLHRALLAAKIAGTVEPFERQIQIVGLGYKAIAKGNQLECSLGYSHKILFTIPEGVTVTIDKTGQKLSLKSQDSALVGHVVSQLRALRPPEPYKQTGIRRVGERIRQKAGKKG